MNSNPGGGMGGGGGGPGTIVAAGDLSSLALRTAKSFATKHKFITASYLYGLTSMLFLIVVLGGSGISLTLDQRRKYDDIMSTVDLRAEYDAASSYHAAHAAHYHAKGWLSCDAHCQHYKRISDRKKREWDEIRAEGNARMSDARSVAGLWSEVGVDEVKESFWGYFQGGKDFARRQSMWDAMFMGMRSMSRDESMVEYMLKMLVQVLINFSMGLIMALVIFIFGLWGIIRTYQPNPLTGLFFFVTASCAAFAFVSSYLMFLFGAAGGGLYGMAKLAESNMRIEGGGGGGGGQQRRDIRGGRIDRTGGGGYNRPHYQ